MELANESEFAAAIGGCCELILVIRLLGGPLHLYVEEIGSFLQALEMHVRVTLLESFLTFDVSDSTLKVELVVKFQEDHS